MVIDGMITTSDLSNAYYVLHNSDSDDFQKLQAINIINNCPLDVKNDYNKIRSRKKRYRKRLIKLFNNYDNLFFCTMTFDEEHVNDYDFYIKRFVKELRILKISYLINEDYGSEYGRVHYHMVAPLSNYKLKKLWDCGFSYAKRIKINSQSFYRISDYCFKLSNHALKDTNKRFITYYKSFFD